MAPMRPAPLRLPASVFTTPAAPARRTSALHLIDSHVHVWSSSQLSSRTMTWPAIEGGIMGAPHPISAYLDVVQRGMVNLEGTKFRGWVFVQAEVVHDDEDTDGSTGGWDASIDEIETLMRENAASAHPELLLGIVPWAPLHHGPSAMSLYTSRLPPLSLPLIKSFRYLLQDSPKGFFLTDEFIGGLKFLGEKGWAFDMTLDTRRDVGVLEDAVECIMRVREGQLPGQETHFILDHFSKPDLVTPPSHPPSASYESYLTSLFSLSLLPHLTLKLSGLLPCASPTLVSSAFDSYTLHLSNPESKMSEDYEELRSQIMRYLEPALEAFGEERIIIGSDWPIFRTSTFSPSSSLTGVAEREGEAWSFGLELYRDCLVRLGIEGEGMDKVFEGNARRVYKLGI